MRRYWLIFAQAVTVCLGILFVVTTLRPDLLRLVGPDAAPAATLPPVAVAARPVAGAVSYADGVARAAPSVVNVYTTKHVDVPLVPLPDDPILRQLFGQVPGVSRRQASTSLGSGVVVNHDGYVLTNYHVVQAADAIEVALADGRKDTAKVVGADPDTDLAVLKLASLRNLPAATLAPDRGLRVGDVVLAIGNPFGLSQTVTQGIVSATGRGRLGVTDFEDFIQTDAAINFGNSGGALINTNGELIGINTAVLAQNLGTDGISFAIPVNMVRGVMDQILAHGRVRRGWLGVTSEEVPRATAAALGIDPPAALRISDVAPQGPAATVGLQRDDLVTHLNGQPILNATEALNRVAAMAPGSLLNIQARRGTQRLTFKATLEERPPRGDRQAGG